MLYSAMAITGVKISRRMNSILLYSLTISLSVWALELIQSLSSEEMYCFKYYKRSVYRDKNKSTPEVEFDILIFCYNATLHSHSFYYEKVYFKLISFDNFSF
jgi:hypothetical protein